MKIVLASLSFVVLAGCGIKGDPLPPAEQETLQKQEPQIAPRVSPQPSPTTEATTSTIPNKKAEQKKKK